jgi:hypothetical protein
MDKEYPIPTGESEDGLQVVQWTNPDDIFRQAKLAAQGKSPVPPNPVKTISINDRRLLGNAVIAAEDRAKLDPNYRMKDLSHISGLEGVMAMRSQTGEQYQSNRTPEMMDQWEMLNSANSTLGSAFVGIKA